MTTQSVKQSRPSRLPHLAYGGDYNPEQWPEEIWPEDVRLMGETGVSMVSLGIFSWSKLEPRPGQYEFEWLDRVLNLLHAGGIAVDLATATASPPPWLARLHPESLPVTQSGQTLWPGSRQAYCPNSQAYRQAAQALVTQLARRYGEHPALTMWHINNEYACHVSACYCDNCAVAFRKWLQARYASLEDLNRAWGTAFWSQQYAEWDEINPPRLSPSFINPAQQLDYKRFCSDSILECYEVEKAVLDEITPTLPVTTNFMGFFKPLDYWKWAAREDIVSHDSYPDPADPEAKIDSAIHADLMRSLGRGRPWILMEQVTSQVNWRRVNRLKRPGQMRLWSYQNLARGANGLMFFQWRASQSGGEKFHGAMVPHVGTSDSRVWREVVQLGRELAGLDELMPSRVKPQVAIVFDWENWWALELDSKPSAELKMLEQLKSYYKPLFEHNIAINFVHPEADLSDYRVVLVPNLYLLRSQAAQSLENFVVGGGRLLVSFFSGIVNESEQIYLGGYPAPLRKVLGLRVEEFDPYSLGQTNRIQVPGVGSFECSTWSDLLNLEGAEALASFEQDFYAGRPALTRHKFGAGQAYYLATRPEQALMDWLLQEVCGEPDLPEIAQRPAGVEIVRREDGTSRFVFLLNHNAAPVEVGLNGTYFELLTSQTAGPSMTLEPYGVALLKTEG